MTVTYTSFVSRVRLLGFPRLLRAWRGSVYKLLYREMLIYCLVYSVISMVYRLVMDDYSKTVFEKLVVYCDAFTNVIPVSFILGFYISLIAQRWWGQYLSIPWPDRIISYIGAHMIGSSEDSRILRRTLVRYLILSLVIIFQSIAPAVKKRFPTLDHITASGLMTPSEQKLYESLPSAHHKYWVPMQWACTLLARARHANLIADDFSLNILLEEINLYKGGLGMLFSYDWISLPLVYTQVTTISVYSFYLTTLVGRQLIPLERARNLPGIVLQNHVLDIYVPIFTIAQLFFYLGLLKVAESMINPFGLDDDDFEVNWMIDRNLQIGLLSVDQMYDQLPPLERDRFWEDEEATLPYTRSSKQHYASTTWQGSVANVAVDNHEAMFYPMTTIEESSELYGKLFKEEINSHELLLESTLEPHKNNNACSEDVQNPKVTTPLIQPREGNWNNPSCEPIVTKPPEVVPEIKYRKGLGNIRQRSISQQGTGIFSNDASISSRTSIVSHRPRLQSASCQTRADHCDAAATLHRPTMLSQDRPQRSSNNDRPQNLLPFSTENLGAMRKKSEQVANTCKIPISSEARLFHRSMTVHPTAMQLNVPSAAQHQAGGLFSRQSSSRAANPTDIDIERKEMAASEIVAASHSHLPNCSVRSPCDCEDRPLALSTDFLYSSSQNTDGDNVTVFDREEEKPPPSSATVVGFGKSMHSDGGGTPVGSVEAPMFSLETIPERQVS